MKRCSICGEEKPFTEFYVRDAARHKLYGFCKLCNYKKGKLWYTNNRELANAKSRAWSKSHPERRKEIAIKCAFGLDPHVYRTILKIQNGCCAICRQPMKQINVDHEHGTKKIRGLLCRGCNLGLGHFKDSEAALAAAIAYLRNSKEQY